MSYDAVDPQLYETRHERSPREAYMHDHWAPRFEAAFREVAQGRVLELGCGAGVYTAALALATDVVGIDLSQRFLESAVQRVPGGRFARADAHLLPFADASFDAVVSIGIMEYLQRGRAFAEITRVLRHDGRLVFASPNRHSPFRATLRAIRWVARQPPTCDEPSRSEIEQLCARFGFTIESIEMTDTLIWLPDAIDSRVGHFVYRWLGTALGRVSGAHLSSVMLVKARKTS